MTTWRHRLQGWFWDHSLLWRRPLRSLREVLSAVRYRLRHAGRPQPPRVLTQAAAPNIDSAPLQHPAVGLLVDGEQRHDARSWLEWQTETSVVIWPMDDPPTHCAEPTYWLTYHPSLGSLPETLVESLLLAAAVDDVPFLYGGWTSPAPDVAGPRAALRDGTFRAVLYRAPQPAAAEQMVARVVPHITGPAELGPAGSPGGDTAETIDRPLSSLPASRAGGPYVLRGDVTPGSLVCHPLRCPRRRLAALPPIDGAPSILLLLPFLAVGGAERLLFDLLAGLRRHYRCLVVTLEPHRRDLGQTVDACRKLTPYVYTLGDWLPRSSHDAAVEHLLQRYRVRRLVCWNGAVAFYDAARRWKDRCPGLRIFNQLYNHRGGWIEHYGRRFIDTVDVHLAINRAIADALVERGVPEHKVATVHHGVEIPRLPDAPTAAARRRQARRILGLDTLPPETIVVGTFIRLHRQKRPLDILAVARRLQARRTRNGEGPPVHFILVGGGPMDDDIAQRLNAEPHPNLTRFGLRDDLETLYDAVDVCLLTSAYEGLPIFLLDGLARQRPCVATAVGEIPELLADGGGILVQTPGDIDALADGIEALLDPERRHREGLRGRQTVSQRFGLATYRQRYEDLFFGPPRAPQEATP